jgi:hypothetical protein
MTGGPRCREPVQDGLPSAREALGLNRREALHGPDVSTCNECLTASTREDHCTDPRISLNAVKGRCEPIEH